MQAAKDNSNAWFLKVNISELIIYLHRIVKCIQKGRSRQVKRSERQGIQTPFYFALKKFKDYNKKISWLSGSSSTKCQNVICVLTFNLLEHSNIHPWTSRGPSYITSYITTQILSTSSYNTGNICFLDGRRVSCPFFYRMSALVWIYTALHI